MIRKIHNIGNSINSCFKSIVALFYNPSQTGEIIKEAVSIGMKK